MRIIVTGACLAMLGLAGCEEFNFTEPTDAESIYLDLQEENAAIRTELDTLDVTPNASIPTTGAATYDGSALIALDTPIASELIGHAGLTADFETGILSGQMRGFYGTINGADAEAVDGTIVISNGLIDTTLADQVGADADGTLVGSSDTLVVDATLTGNFMGAPVVADEAPAGITLDSTPDSVFTLNGGVMTGGLDVIGLDDPLP